MLPRENRRPGRPPAVKASETRQRIIHAARQMFSERGYDGATFQAIAARADLTRPSINHYYASKRELYRDVMDDANELIIGAGIKQAEFETTLVARLTAFVSAAVQAHAEDPAASALIIGGVLESQRQPLWTTTENASVRIAREFLIRAVNDAIDRGEIAGIDKSVLVDAVLVIAAGVGLYAAYIQSQHKLLAVTGVLRQMLEDALRGPHG